MTAAKKQERMQTERIINKFVFYSNNYNLLIIQKNIKVSKKASATVQVPMLVFPRWHHTSAAMHTETPSAVFIFCLPSPASARMQAFTYSHKIRKLTRILESLMISNGGVHLEVQRVPP